LVEQADLNFIFPKKLFDLWLGDRGNIVKFTTASDCGWIA